MSASSAVRKPATVQYAILSVLILITAAYQIRHGQFVYDFVRDQVYAVRSMASVHDDKPVVTDVESEGAKAGLQKGDTVLEVGGQAFTRVSQIASAVEYARPGDKLSLKVQHANGVVEELLIPMVARQHFASDHWLFALALHVILPLACVVLGFGVALLRPREPLAWVLLALLLGFSQTFSLSMENYEGTLAASLAATYKAVFSSTWLMWLFVLGVYFPERLEFERRHPWLKYLLILPLALSSVLGVAEMEAGLRGFAAVQRMERIVPLRSTGWMQQVSAAIMLSAIAAFFLLIVVKYFTATSRDARRRLRLLYGGMFLALMPTLTLVLIGIATHKGLDDFPAWIELPCLLATLLFPITLAYIIVAYRAMDIQVALRQGLRYTLAQRGIRLLQALLTAGLALFMVKLADRPGMNAHRMMPVMGIGIPLIFGIGYGAKWLGGWVDRRFFRESYNADQVLIELSEQVRSIVETRPLLETVAQRISQSLHVPQVAVLLRNTQYTLAYAQGFDATPHAEFTDDSATVRQLLNEKRPARVYLDDPGNWINRRDEVSEEERTMLARLRTELLVPLQAAGRLLGFLALGQKRSEEPYSRTDLQLLGSVAAQTGLALENARLTSAVAEEAAQREAMKREVEIAREVQERLFPQNLPQVDGLDYCGLCRPARGVGGDYYDFLPLPGGALGIAIGDVAGKGISAALMMASLQASLRGQTMTGPENLAAVVGRVNRLVYEVSSPERYATFFFARYEPATRQLTYVNAGHNPPMLLRRSNGAWTVTRLKEGGTVVGLLPHFDYSQATVELQPGDVLAAFTDGISEAMNAADEEWGEEQLLATLQQCDGLCAADSIARVVAAADQFTAGARQYDDMTVVVLKVQS